MARYAILDENFKVKDVRDFDELPAHKAGRVRPLEDSKPSFDPDAEYLEVDTFDIKADTVTRVYKVIPLPPEVVAKIKLLKATVAITTVDGKEETITLRELLRLGF